MCGIAGLIGLEPNQMTIDKMMKTMKRRGPDGAGKYVHDECVLLHSRLSIIDLEGGKQPMILNWENEEYVISYNGELYNTEELRRELIGLGHVFETHSDTEVMLHGYAQWGLHFLDKINGIFAFAVWHKREKKLFLARDRMGVKPLFYMAHRGGFLFASEIKTILTYPTVKAQLDTQGIGEIILLGPGRIPGSGVFRGIYELEPGCCGEFFKGKWVTHRYWSLKDREHRESFEETAEHVRYLVLDAIKRQMVSDVPIGTFLSGGLDSSIITAVCASELRKRGESLSTFSVDYDKNDRYFVPGKYQPTADARYIDIMKEFSKTNHAITILTPEALIENMQQAVIARDLPGMADVDVSLLAFCREIRKSVKVALSGECADEIFGGYPWYRDPQVRAQEGFPWSQNVKYRSTFLLPDYKDQLDPDEFVHNLYVKTIGESDILPDTDPTESRMKQMVNLNLRWFMQTLLDRKDRMSMYSGLEVRVPFCDHRIAEYLYGVPWEYKDHMGKEKGLLRYAMRGILPEEILYRKKSPYPKTHDPKYMLLVKGMLNDIISQKDAAIFSVVKKETLRSLAEKESIWPWYGQLMRTPQTIAYMIQIHMWLEHYKIDII